MAFAVHMNRENCTGCNNCVVACPVDTLEIHSVDPSTYDKIHKVKDGKCVVLDFGSERSGVCVKACQHDVKRTGPWESRAQANVL